MVVKTKHLDINVTDTSKLVYLLAFPQVQCILIENKTDQFSTWDQLKTVPEVIVKWRFGKDTSWQKVIQHGRDLATESKDNFPCLLVQVLFNLNSGEAIIGTFHRRPKCRFPTSCQDQNWIREKFGTVGDYLLDPEHLAFWKKKKKYQAQSQQGHLARL